jgi:hypothetical protein
MGWDLLLVLCSALLGKEYTGHVGQRNKDVAYESNRVGIEWTAYDTTQTG